jgi:hypothetical protein
VDAAVRDRRLQFVLLGLWGVVVLAVGLPMVIARHFHADEIQVAYNIALWGVHDFPEASNYASPYMVPLVWLIGGLDTGAASGTSGTRFGTTP